MSENPDFINSFIDSIRKNGELEEYLKYAIKEEYVEFEMIFGDLKDKSKMLNKDQFIRLRDTLSSINSIIARKKPKIIIYGAGRAGAYLLRTIVYENSYQTICFIDEDPELWNRAEFKNAAAS